MRAFLAIVGVMIVAIAVAVTIAFLRPSTASDSPEEVGRPAKQAPPPPPAKLSSFDEMKAGAIHAILDIEGKGTIEMELYPKAAPKTVEHFAVLCKRHFYDGILVHRVESDPAFRVFQAGDPKSKEFDPKDLRGKTTREVGQSYHLGMGGSGSTVPLEARLPNDRYTVGLARSESPSSGDSQFYVNLSDNTSLNGKYCVFGRVTGGQDVADKVAIGDRIRHLTVQ